MAEPARHRPGKEGRLNVRATERQLNLLRQAAEAQGRSLSDFILTAATDRAEEVLVERRHFVASPEAWHSFMAALDDPPEPNAALIQLLRDAGAPD
jgi:uncharacterized protein (DUF1778 family)